MSARRTGGENILTRLCELMFVEAVCRHLQSLTSDDTGWLAALRYRQIGSVLSLMHARPAFAWTLGELARQAGLSRTILAERFAHYVGMPPMQYLARWRMQMAARLLADSDIGVAAVAAEVGYESEASFRRAFKKLVGVPPATCGAGTTPSLRMLSAQPQQASQGRLTFSFPCKHRPFIGPLVPRGARPQDWR